ncbi:MAG: response regulator [bacterium]|nr:response regulator [bacterium]
MTTKKILVVEDEEDIRKLLENVLQAKGFEVIGAGDGIEAVNMTYHEEPDLIILDIRLPEMDGYQVCRLLKTDEKYQHIPIIMLTALPNLWSRFRGLHTGADMYIIKSAPDFSFLKIAEMVEEMLTRQPTIERREKVEDRRQILEDSRQEIKDKREHLKDRREWGEDKRQASEYR